MALERDARGKTRRGAAPRTHVRTRSPGEAIHREEARKWETKGNVPAIALCQRNTATGLSKVHAKATTKRDGASAEDRDGTGRGGGRERQGGRQTEQEARRKRDGCPHTRMPIARAMREYACTRERRLLARRERASETGGRASEIADEDARRRRRPIEIPDP